MGADERGLVLEIRGKEAIVLTPQGEFRRVRVPQPFPSIGEEIMLPPASSWTWARMKFAATAVALVFLAWGLSRIFSPGILARQQPAFYVAIDINPSLELVLNTQEKVMEANSLNTDGKVLLEGLNLRGQDVQDALRTLAKVALEKGYLRPGEEGFLLVSVVPGKETEEGIEAGDRLAGRLAKVAEEVLRAERVEPVVKAGTFKVELRKQAARLGLSPGKYALFLKALEAGLPVTVEALKERGALKALRQAGADPQKLWDSIVPDVRDKGEQHFNPVSPKEGSHVLERENRENKEGLPKKNLPPLPEGRLEEKPSRESPGVEKEGQDIGTAQKRGETGKAPIVFPKREETPGKKGDAFSPQDIKVNPEHPSKGVRIPERMEENKEGNRGIKEQSKE
ncbi:Anti-sigma factor N-terminus [Thermanaeromonas toyohensis ToBE]|uniref:Anti-sigma factor N-terminus n=1 Tax=Thermanaeromonas toyohensis ToBE TaxID=698762 RepID=A0A1W1VZS2_9FIRM|nr:anti-sigma factor domain-containing protein [Thermanaeromonas toyohensis]SMB98857.1 Anti-sigma factor N-terminus [Thermanaeromonas toyohensis ToBE]